jgi:hypothetical protein
MQTPINSRDLSLQNTVPRVLGISTNYINLTCPTQQFKYGTDNLPQPQSTVVTASLIGNLTGTVTFTTTGLNPVPVQNGNTLAINPDHFTGDIVTVTASLTYLGTTYTAVPISISKIYNQLVARTTRAINLVPSYTDGTGYTLPAADNYVELYNGVVKLTSDVVYGPATQTKNGLTVQVNSETGLITLSQTAVNTWTSDSESFTFTATKGVVSYTTTYTITKAKQGAGGQQVAELSLYQWSTTQPPVPTGTSTYTWATLDHTYVTSNQNPDTWTVAVPANPGNVGIKLWKITKGISAEAASNSTTLAVTWATGYSVAVVTTTANSTIKTARVTVYKNDTSIPTITGTSTYSWSSGSITANLPTGWFNTEPAAEKGFSLYAATVNITENLNQGSTQVNWSEVSIAPVRYYGTDGFVGSSAITVDLTNTTHAIPTDSAGANANFANSGTDVFVYEGATALGFLSAADYATASGAGTAAGKYTVTSASNTVTAGEISAVTVNSVIGARFANLTAAGFATTATGLLNITVTGKRVNGTDFTYLVTQTFTKTPSGEQGVPGVAYWLVTTASVIQKNIANVYSPSSITISAKKSTGSTASDYSGYFKIFLNGSGTATYTSSAAETSKAYTIPASTTSILVRLYADSGFTQLLDEETIPVVSDGATGSTGASARRAYVVATGTPSGTPATFTATGDKLPVSDDATPVPAWFTGKTWLAAAPSTPLAAGEILYQSDGVYTTGGNTVWGYPYISALKVGSLSAITVNTGGLTVSDYIKSGATNLTEGTGFYLNSSGYFRAGTAGGARIQYDSSGLAIYNASNTAILSTGGQLLWGAVGGDGKPANNATVGATVGVNVYDSQSVTASLGRIFNNLLDPGKWTISSGNQPGFNQNGETNENQVIADLAPDGAPSLIWRATSVGAGGADGGWDSDTFAFDHTRPYRFTVWIKMSGNTTGSAYLGVGGSTVKNLSDSSVNNNPYFFAVGRNGYVAGRWYLFVGYVWPSSYTGTVNASKIYDSVTGEAVTNGTDYKWNSASTVTTHRSYQYYTNAGAVQDFWSPRVDIIDGSETPITTLLAIAKSGLAASSASASASSASNSAGSSAQSAASSAASALSAASSATAANDALQLVGGITWQGDATIRLVSGTRLIKDGTGATAGWNAHRYSAESYTGGAYLSFQPASIGHFMIGLNTDPTTNSSYETIDYAWYCIGDGNLYAYESGTGINLGITYDTNTVLSITYDNQYVRYFKNGVLARTVDTGTGSGIRFYIDSSFHDLNAEAKSIRFGPNAAKGAVAGNLSITGNGSFKRSEALTISPSSMVLTAVTQNFTSISSYTWKIGGVTITAQNSSSTVSSNTLTVSSEDFTNTNSRVYSVEVTGTLNGVSTTLTDQVTINRLDDGASTITINCSNENVTFTSTTNTGYTGINFSGGGSVFTVYKGGTQLAYGTGNNQWRVTNYTYTGVSYLTTLGAQGNTWQMLAPSAMTQDTAYTDITITYKDPGGNETTYNRRVTYSIARTGAKGADSTTTGPRGNQHLYLSGYTEWNTTTRTAVEAVFTNSYGGKVINDMVTVYGTNFSQTRVYTGNTGTGDNGWVVITVAIDGNLLVSGTVSAAAISTTNAFIGHKLQDADGLFVLDFYNKTLSITTT